MSVSTLSLKMFVLSLGLSLALSACGTKGPLEPPPSAATEPAKKSKPDDGLGDIPTLGQKKTESKPIEAPKQPFIFDFLL